MAANPVGRLNEYCTKHGQRFSDEYTQTGPPHNRTFGCTITMGERRGQGEGNSKKDAKANAASSLLQQLESQPPTITLTNTLTSALQAFQTGTGATMLPRQPNHTPSPPTPTFNHKGTLQEFCQKHSLNMPEYFHTKSGPAHQVEFTVKCTVRNAHSQLVGAGQGNANSKKSAEGEAALSVYEYLISAMEQHGSLPIIEGDIDLPADSPDSSEPAAAAAPSHVKGRLQELCQRNSLLVPTYKLISKTGPTHTTDFTVKCQIKDVNGEIIEEEFGYGKAIKIAEIDAASKLIPKVQSLIESISSGVGGVSPRFPSKSARSGHPSAAVTDPVEEDELVATLIGSHCDLPEFLFKESEPADPKDPSTIKHLCLAFTNVNTPDRIARNCPDYDVKSMPVIGQGIGDLKDEAKKDALINLICNVRALGIV